MKKIFFLACSIFMLFQYSPCNEITLQEFYALVKTNNPNYKKASLSKKIFEASQNKYLGNKNIRLFSNATFYNQELATGFPVEPKIGRAHV